MDEFTDTLKVVLDNRMRNTIFVHDLDAAQLVVRRVDLFAEYCVQSRRTSQNEV